ncbi:MAG TPA: Ig-like domain repeat protein [Gryllotalpicola sp.]
MKSNTTTRRVAVAATGALVALTGALLSATAANAVTQTPDPNNNFSVTRPSNPVNRASVPSTVDVTDANGKTVQLPKVAVVGDQAHDTIFPPDPNNTTGATVVPISLFFYIPSTGDLEFVGNPTSKFPITATSASPTAVAYDPLAASAVVEALAPGTEFDWIIAQTPFNPDGTAGDPTVLGPTENYYEFAWQWNGLNPATGTYESGAPGTTPNQPPAAAVDTTTVLAATADANGGVQLTATVEDAAGATDTTATGNVTFHADGLTDVTVPVTAGVATTTVSRPATQYATAYSFTAAYAGDSAFNPSTSAAVSVTTSAAPANSGQATSNETVTIPAPAAGELTLTVADGGVAFGTATEDVDAGTFSASAPLPESTVTDNRFQKDDWTLNGSSTALISGTNSIPASALSWAAPTVTGTADAGTTPGSAANDLTEDQALALFHTAGLNGLVTSTVNTQLSLTTPVTQAVGDYAGTLTITLI